MKNPLENYASRSCKECSELFNPKQKAQIFCNKDHYRVCENPDCGKSFLVERRRLNGKQKTCDNSCAAAYRKNKDLELSVRACGECGDTFTPGHFNSIYCSRAHERVCENCGNPYLVETAKLSKPTRACGNSCGSALTHSVSSKKKRRLNSLEKYGVDFPFQSPEVKEKIRLNIKAQMTRYGSEGFKETMVAKYGVENGFQLPGAVPGSISLGNLSWQKKLENLTGSPWELERYFKDVGKIDLYCEMNGVKIAVEISPTATHNSHQHKIACNRRGCEELPCKKHSKGRLYHQEKALTLKELHGVELLTFFDWMDETKVIEFLRAKFKLLPRKIAAKKCQVREISQKEANIFLREYHLMGASRKQTKCYGLFIDDELLQVQTFSPRGENGQWEARRLATKNGLLVVGGISKITKLFIRNEDPNEIVAFTDLNLSSGGFDSTFNGFQKKEIQKPMLCWSKGRRIVLQKSAVFQSADRLIGLASNSKESPYPESWSNHEVFLAEGWLPVWDCGKIKEVWTKATP